MNAQRAMLASYEHDRNQGFSARNERPRVHEIDRTNIDLVTEDIQTTETLSETMACQERLKVLKEQYEIEFERLQGYLKVPTSNEVGVIPLVHHANDNPTLLPTLVRDNT